MALVSLAKVTVTTSGTPVKVSSSSVNANTVFFQMPFTGNTGPYIYIGVAGIVIATLVSVLHILTKRVAATDPLDYWMLQPNAGTGPIDLSTIFLDADHSGDWCQVSYLVL
jgi:hypothetical protein